jgi:hypothetical protein
MSSVVLAASAAVAPKVTAAWGMPKGFTQDGFTLHEAFCIVRPPVSGNPNWHILDDAGHMPLPRNTWGVQINGSGRLEITYPAVSRIGVFTITHDETWARHYSVGGSVGFDKAVIQIWNHSGTEVYPNNLSGVGNWWVDFKFWLPEGI